MAVAPEDDRAERRRLSVVFCDLVGSTRLSEMLDPEDMRDLLGTYQGCCVKAVESAGGHVAQYLGDGVLVYFGYPQSHEDDARRAVRAALQIVKSVAKIPAPAGAPPIAARVGIHTGLVVVGEVGRGGHRENLAIGDTPNVAARLQGEADPHQVIISSETLGLVRGFFETTDLGERELKGVKGTTRLHRVDGETGVVRRIDAAVRHGLTPFVGDHGESDAIAQRWAEAEAGTARAVLLMGEAGIGKSRHVEIAKKRVDAGRVIECFCSPDLQNSPLHPFTRAFEGLFGLTEIDDAATRFAKIRAHAEPLGLGGDEDLALLAGMLAVPVPADHPPLTLSARRQRQRTLELVLAVVHGISDREALLLTVEDLHWADPSTLEAIGLLLAGRSRTRLLLLATARPEFVCPWADQPMLVELRLSRLGDEQVGQMIGNLTKGVRLPSEVMRALIERSEGVPLFVEEITKAVLESGALVREDRYVLRGTLADEAIPTTVHESLLARLDRLGDNKRLAQVAAVLGRSFSGELLRAVTDLPNAQFDAALNALIEADFVRPEADAYSFRHALLRDAAYDSLLRSSRRELHLRVARTYESRFAHPADAQPELVAHHFGAGGEPQRAAQLWAVAGQRALRRNAHLEAAALLRAALDAVAEMPESQPRALAELDVLMALAPALIFSQGYGAPDLEKTWARAQELCAIVGDVPQRVPALIGSWMFACIRSRHRDALALSARIVELAQAAQSDDLLLEGHLCVGVSSFCTGDLVEAASRFERVRAMYDLERHASHRFLFGNDPASVALSYLSLIRWLLGDEALGRQVSTESIELATGLNHPFTAVFALSLAAWHRLFCDELDEAEAFLGECHELSQREGVPRLLSGILAAWLLARRGDPSANDAFYGATAYYKGSGSRCFLPLCEAARADALSLAGLHAEAEVCVASSIEAVELTGERWAEAEIHRLRGQILERRGAATEEVEACYRHAIELGKRAGAKAWEQRAAQSLATWLEAQGRPAEASATLDATA